MQLISGEHLIIHIPNFYSEKKCSDAVSRIKELDTKDVYEVTENIAPIFKIGKAVFDYAKSQDLTDYYAQIKSVNDDLDFIFQSDNPIKSVFNIFNSLWENGACVDSFEKNKDLYYGLIRIFKPDSFILPHQDMTHWDISKFEKPKNIINQLSCNVYLDCPDDGGELRLYDFSFHDKNSYDSNKLENSYGLNVDGIQELTSFSSVRPKKGDLILFNSRFIHEVKPFHNKEDLRISASCFINFYGKTKPLGFFS